MEKKYYKDSAVSRSKLNLLVKMHNIFLLKLGYEELEKVFFDGICDLENEMDYLYYNNCRCSCYPCTNSSYNFATGCEGKQC